MLATAVIAGAIGRPVDEVVPELRKAVGRRRRVVSAERAQVRFIHPDETRVQVWYDAENRIVFDVKEG